VVERWLGTGIKRFRFF